MNVWHQNVLQFATYTIEAAASSPMSPTVLSYFGHGNFIFMQDSGDLPPGPKREQNIHRYKMIRRLPRAAEVMHASLPRAPIIHQSLICPMNEVHILAAIHNTSFDGHGCEFTLQILKPYNEPFGT